MRTDDVKDSYLPNMRISAELRQRLDRVAAQSVTQRLTDHVRFALERYVKEEEAALQLRAPQQS